MARGKNTVLVYGTLRKGCENHEFLETSKYSGIVEVNGFRMITLGEWPYIMRSVDNDRIIAEKYFVDAETLAVLDWLEVFNEANSPDNLFERIEISTEPEGKAWIYVISDATYERIKGDCAEVPGGDWMNRIRHSSGYSGPGRSHWHPY